MLRLTLWLGGMGLLRQPLWRFATRGMNSVRLSQGVLAPADASHDRVEAHRANRCFYTSSCSLLGWSQSTLGHQIECGVQKLLERGHLARSGTMSVVLIRRARAGKGLCIHEAASVLEMQRLGTVFIGPRGSARKDLEAPSRRHPPGDPLREALSSQGPGASPGEGQRTLFPAEGPQALAREGGLPLSSSSR